MPLRSAGCNDASESPAAPAQIQFTLTDRGELSLERFGEGTKEEMISFAYPLLERALDAAYLDEDYESSESLPPDRKAAIARAVENERSRIDLDETQTNQPLTELGRGVKSHTDMPTVLIDQLDRYTAQ